MCDISGVIFKKTASIYLNIDSLFTTFLIWPYRDRTSPHLRLTLSFSLSYTSALLLIRTACLPINPPQSTLASSSTAAQATSPAKASQQKPTMPTEMPSSAPFTMRTRSSYFQEQPHWTSPPTQLRSSRTTPCSTLAMAPCTQPPARTSSKLLSWFHAAIAREAWV